MDTTYRELPLELVQEAVLRMRLVVEFHPELQKYDVRDVDRILEQRRAVSASFVALASYHTDVLLLDSLRISPPTTL